MYFLFYSRDEYESVVHSNDNIAPVGYINFKKIHVQEKNVSWNILYFYESLNKPISNQEKLFQDGLEGLTLQERLKNVPIKTPSDYITEIVGPELHDGCNLSEDENDEHDCTDNNLRTSNSGKF